MAEPSFHVIERKGWSYVVDEDGCDVGEYSGPWRYRWEAQEYADDLNKQPERKSSDA